MVKKQKIFSFAGQIFIVVLLGIITVIPFVFDRIRTSTTNGKGLYDTLYETYITAICVLDVSSFILYSATLFFLNYWGYKLHELSLYLALLLFVLAWLSLHL
jgi:hypothetical protein